jgi:hypothetical protein
MSSIFSWWGFDIINHVDCWRSTGTLSDVFFIAISLVWHRFFFSPIVHLKYHKDSQQWRHFLRIPRKIVLPFVPQGAMRQEWEWGAGSGRMAPEIRQCLFRVCSKHWNWSNGEARAFTVNVCGFTTAVAKEVAILVYWSWLFVSEGRD